MTKYNHLCKEQRNTIEHLLNKEFDFTYIWKAINVDRTTISKEVRRNRYVKSSYFSNYSKTSIKRALDNCDKLSKPPYCCNSCKNKAYCTKIHIYYNSKKAQEHYEENLINSRIGIDTTEEKIKIINKNIVPLIKNKKQSVNQTIRYFTNV